VFIGRNLPMTSTVSVLPASPEAAALGFCDIYQLPLFILQLSF